jgi:hypothetical protein
MQPGQEMGMPQNAPPEPAPAAPAPQEGNEPQVTIGEIVPDDEQGLNQ